MSSKTPRVRLLLAPIGAGANEPRLMEGPEAIAASLAASRNGWALEMVSPPGNPAVAPEGPDEPDEYARLHHLVDVRLMADVLAPRVAETMEAAELPIVLGGDHTVAIGGFTGVRRALGPEPRLGIVWVDAHPDLNTPATTPSNHGHGMPLAALLGFGHPILVNAGGISGAKLSLGDTALVGARSIDPGEAEFLSAHPEILVIRPETVRAGLEDALRPLVNWARDLDALYLSFDLDAVDPKEAPGVTTPVPGGLTASESLELVRSLTGTGRLVAADVVEHLPARDRDGRTARLAACIIETLVEELRRA
jgi:arginase